MPPLPRSGTASDNYHDAVTRTIVSEAHAMVSDIHRTVVQGQEGSGAKHLSVSDGHALAVTE